MKRQTVKGLRCQRTGKSSRNEISIFCNEITQEDRKCDIAFLF